MNDERKLNIIFWFSIAAAVIYGYYSAVMAQTVSYLYYYALLLEPILIFIAIYTFVRKNRIKTINYIESSWAKPENRKRDFEIIEGLYKELLKDSKDTFHIDDQTFDDLNIKDIYSILDHTYSHEGQHVLYYLLRTPFFDKETFEKRNNVIEFLRKNKDVREKLQYIFYKNERKKNNDILTLLFGKTPSKIFFTSVLVMLSLGALASIISIPFIGVKGLLFMVLFLMINGSIHGAIQKKIYKDANAIGQLGEIVRAAKKISQFKNSELLQYTKELKECSSKCSRIGDRTVFVNRIEGIDIIGDYVAVLFLIKEISFFSVINDIKKYKNEIKKIYMLLGEIEALISIASFRDERKDYAIPEFITDHHGIFINDMVHPLVKNAVPNPINIENGGILLTGSNMSGKSTFLRTLGVNVLFAQTICTCLCKSYHAEFFKILTSISPGDNIIGGKSYYLGESEALLRMLNESTKKISCLCIIDEIFRGTNPIERISAAAEILDYLPNHNSITVVATHDIELTRMVKNHYECCYFTEDVNDSGLVFDYKIKKGIIKTRNAIKLLRFLGYPKEIVDRADERAKKANESSNSL